MNDIEIKLRPIGEQWTREKTKYRRHAPFKATRSHSEQLLKREAHHLSCKGPIILQADFIEDEFRLDGGLRATAKPPIFPGVIITIDSRDKGALKFYCDEFNNWEHNIRGISLTLERLRLADLYGVTKRGEQYTGWRALPPAMVTPAPMTADDAAAFIHAASKLNGSVTPTTILRDPEVLRTAYRAAAARLHPDATETGHSSDWLKLMQAKEVLEKRT